MVTVDAVCPVHGLIKAKLGLPSGVLIENCAVSCPVCRRPSEIVDGVYDTVGRIARTLWEADATKEDIAKLREVAVKAKTGTLSPEEATREAAAINPAFKNLAIGVQDNVGVWALIFIIVTLLLQTYTSWAADKAAAQAHSDSENELRATESVGRVQQRLYDELRLQREAATAQAQASAPKKASQAKKPKGVERRRRGRQRQEMSLARRKSRKKA